MKQFLNIGLFLSLCLIGIQTLNAQCTGITLTTQAEVDTWDTTCTSVEGTLYISGDDIVDLTPLSNLIEVQDLSIVNNTILEDLTGLENILTIRDLLVEDNPNLINLDPLSNLQSLTTFKVYDNHSITNINNFSPSTAIHEIRIINNNSLKTISEFGGGNCHYIVTDNDSLTTIYESQSFVLEFLNINNNNLLNSILFDSTVYIQAAHGEIINNASLESIQMSLNLNIAEFTISENQNLTDLNINVDKGNYCNLSLANISEGCARLTIDNNDALTHLDNLNVEKLSSVIIQNNSNLINVDGLQNLDYIHILQIIDNPILQECCLINFDEVYSLTVENNDTGCSSIAEIVEECDNVTQCKFEHKDDIVLTSQEQLDTYDWLGCDTIQGSIILNHSGSDITNLEALSNIVAINGSLQIIYQNNLNNLKGLDNITSIGNLSIGANNNLESLKGLDNLNTVQYLGISSNDILTNIQALSNLQNANTISLYDNDALATLNVFTNITELVSLRIAECDSLTTLEGFNNLTTIHEELEISDNSSLLEIDALSNLQGSIQRINIGENSLIENIESLSNTNVNNGYLRISGQPLLESLAPLSNTTHPKIIRISEGLFTSLYGLHNLETIENQLALTSIPHLTNLNALSNLKSIATYCTIIYCPSLINIEGLANLEYIGEDLKIRNNDNLSECCIIPCLVDIVQDEIIIGDNNTDCNSLEEINDVCPDDYCANVPSYAHFNTKVFLEGAYNDATGIMNSNIQNINLLPLTQPYTAYPYEYNGLESVTSIDDFPEDVVDWILVEARSGTPNLTEANTIVVETNAGFLLADGSIVDTDGNNLTFRDLEYDTPYHFVIRHRNHLDIISKEAVIASPQMTYNFTTSTDQAFGSTQQKELSNGKAAMLTGDYTQDGIIQITDYDVWQENPAQNNVYSITDGTLDGVVQNTDADAWRPNKAKIGVIEIRF